MVHHDAVAFERSHNSFGRNINAQHAGGQILIDRDVTRRGSLTHDGQARENCASTEFNHEFGDTLRSTGRQLRIDAALEPL